MITDVALWQTLGAMLVLGRWAAAGRGPASCQLVCGEHTALQMTQYFFLEGEKCYM
jgi:hypothetical protein